MEQLVSAKTLADRLELTEETVRVLARQGTIPSIKVGWNVRFRVSSVIRHLENNTPERQKAARDIYEALRDTPRPGPAPSPIPAKSVTDAPL